MHLDIMDILKACRRSRVKVRVYRGLVDLHLALIPELADFAQTTPDRVHAVLHGDGRKYRRETSLVSLGVARSEKTPRGPAYTLTHRGESAWAPVSARLAATRGPPHG